MADGLICSLCCGNTRTDDACLGCVFYREPKRQYNDVPKYSVSEMDGNMELESYANSEGALCAYDMGNEGKLNDSDAIRIIELLIDKYHFQDQKIEHDHETILNGVNYVGKSIRDDLRNVENGQIVKVLWVIRFVAKRRTKTRREYMNVIHQHVGQRVGSDIRSLRQ
jgi:hypothetical protein